MYNSIVIGAGVAGSVTARELAERGKQKVLVLEKRDHVGGNCFDEKDAYGILVHTYGPHIFHTEKERKNTMKALVVRQQILQRCSSISSIIRSWSNCREINTVNTNTDAGYYSFVIK